MYDMKHIIIKYGINDTDDKCCRSSVEQRLVSRAGVREGDIEEVELK